jgi:glycosyltransferase involved in cell wall biosynthesis
MDGPRFSIVVPDYEGSVKRSYLLRALDSLQRQTFRNFEVLLLHDGPKDRAYEAEFDRARYDRISHIECTASRHNDSGHTLRDLGIRKARGEYIVHLSADNLLYDFALARIVEEMEISRRPRMDPRTRARIDPNANDIIIFPVLMIGVQSDGAGIWQESRDDARHSFLLSGYPAVAGCIDCMQLVMRRTLWLEYGGWYDRSANSDGAMYGRFVRERRARYVPAVLGEHW